MFLIVESVCLGKKIIGVFSEENKVEEIINRIPKKDVFNPKNINQSMEKICSNFLS